MGNSESYKFTPSTQALPWMKLIQEVERKYDLPTNLVARLIRYESNFNPKAKSPAGAIGIAQIIPKYHPSIDPTDPIASIWYCARFLRQLRRHLNSWEEVLAAYNWGFGNVRKYGMGKLPKETMDYIERVHTNGLTKSI